ncbi:hypothetical protein PENTCL1PPCAC_1869, partial [Pristionchus entomophagus]
KESYEDAKNEEISVTVATLGKSSTKAEDDSVSITAKLKKEPKEQETKKNFTFTRDRKMNEASCTAVLAQPRTTRENPSFKCSTPQYTEIFVDIPLVKQRTQKIGIGVIFESLFPPAGKSEEPLLSPTSPIPLLSPLRLSRPDALELHENVLSEAAIGMTIGSPLPASFTFLVDGQEVDTSVETDVTLKPKKMKKKTVRKDEKLLDVVVSRTRTSSGTSDLMVDVDIEAGEESAQTDAQVDLSFCDYEETELSLSETMADVMEVDVIMEAQEELDIIDAYVPHLPNQFIEQTIQMPTAAAQVKRLFDEFRMPARAEIEGGIQIMERRKVSKRIILGAKGQQVEEKEEEEEREESPEDAEQEITVHPQAACLKSIDDVVSFASESRLPITDVRWFKNGMQLSESERIAITVDGNKTTLTLRGFVPFCVGVYHVVVDNKIGSNPARLDAHLAPVIASSLAGSKVVWLAEKPFDFRCSILAYPQPVVRLLHKGEPSALRYDLEEYDDAASARLKSLRKADSGSIALVATNEYGEAAMEFEIEVVEVPSAVRQLRVTEVTDSSVTLTWQPPIDDGGSPISKYTIERKAGEITRWRQYETTEPGVCTIKIDELLPDEMYAFRIFASNEAGEGKHSNEVEIITGQPPSASLDIEDIPEEEPLKKKSSQEEEEEEGEVVKPKEEVKKKRKVVKKVSNRSETMDSIESIPFDDDELFQEHIEEKKKTLKAKIQAKVGATIVEPASSEAESSDKTPEDKVAEDQAKAKAEDEKKTKDAKKVAEDQAKVKAEEEKKTKDAKKVAEDQAKAKAEEEKKTQDAKKVAEDQPKAKAEEEKK